MERREQETFSLPVGTVTFLLTDIAGSTRLWEAEPVAMAKAVDRHYEILAAAIGDHGGVRPVEQGEGDSVVGAFARASDALAAAFDAQHALRAEPWPPGTDLRVRMAVHTGEAQLRDEGNYFGGAVNRCARLRALAHGGQVIVSRAVHDLVTDRLPVGATLRDLGTHRLRDLGRPEHVFQLCHLDLLDDFPPLQSLDAVPNNLPPQLTSFVGRRGEMVDVHRLLDETRLLTLTGSGGCGKTRLALQVAAERLDAFPDGVWYVELAPLGETTSVGRTVADALNIAEEPDRPITATLVERLHEQHALLIVDNCEHLLAESAAVTEALLRGCPRLQVLATSRAPLNVAGETPWRVPSLALPDAHEPVPLEVLAESDAVRLFVDRAMKSRPDFALSDANATAVAEICRRLDGIPLAIELAAARIRALAPDQVAHGLDDRFRLLTGGSRSVLPRQQTLRASVDWSHHLLSPAEQALFRRLSVFAGTFTLDATTAICSDDSVDDGEVLDLLTQLVDRSLVQIDDIGVEVRYRLLETIKQYGREQLERADETTATRDRHLEWYAAVADRARPALLTSDQPACLARLETDHDNLRGALEWAATSFAVEKLLRMAVDLTFLWFFGGHFREGTGWLEQALTESGPDISLMRARARWGTAYLNFYAGNALTAVDLAQEALAWGEAAGDDLTMARALDTLGSLQQLSDPVAAFTVLQEAEARARAGDDEWCLTDCLQKQAWCFIFRDRYEELGALLDESSALVRRLGYPFFVAYDSIAITWMGVRRGLIADARAAAVDARAAAELSREPLTVAFCAWLHAETELLGGNHAAARDIVDGCRSEMVRRGAQPFTLMVVEFGVARVQIAIGELSPATQDLEEIAAAYATEQILLGLGLILPTLAEALLLDGKFERARSHLIRVLDVAHTLDSPAMLGWAHHLLAAADREGGDHEAAEGHAHEALALFSDHGFRPDSVETLELLAALAADDESWAEAARLLAAADAIRAEHGWVRWPIRQPRVDQTMTKVGAALSVDERAAATADGATLSLDAAIAYARRARGSRGRPSSGWGSLTPTELEVVKLVAAGLTNPQIGERLFIARGTVKIHLSHVFTKLGIGSRAELAAEVTRRGM